MKVTYEFTDDIEDDDHYKIKVFQISESMHSALLEIDDYIRAINKGYKDYTTDEIVENIGDIIFSSRIREVE